MGNYDQYQFEKVPHAVALNTKIAWSDYDRMQTKRGRATRERRWIPAWALNDIQMRHVLAQRCWWYAHCCTNGRLRNSRVPDALINDRIALAKLVDNVIPLMKLQLKKLNAAQSHLRDVHIAMRMRYGYLDLECAIVYRAYRLEENSVQIGEALGISPQDVRQHLVRLNVAARLLGYETHAPHWSVGAKRPHKLRAKKQRAEQLTPGPVELVA